MKVYLAGPMAGCTDEEMMGWRKQATVILGQEMVLDPTVRDYRGIWETPGQLKFLVEADKGEIDEADVVLAFCPKPSYGTVMEILYAWERGKAVVVILPPGALNSPWLRYHSHIILATVEEACNNILSYSNKNQTNKKEKSKTMSNSKFNYYTVTTTTVVRANNKTDALSLARNRRGVPGQSLSQETEIERIPAAEAHSVVASA